MAVAALVLGLLAFLFGLIPIVGWFAFPLGLLAVIFGAVGIGRANKIGGNGKGMAIAGLVLGILYFVWKFLWFSLFASAFLAG